MRINGGGEAPQEESKSTGQTSKGTNHPALEITAGKGETKLPGTTEVLRFSVGWIGLQPQLPRGHGSAKTTGILPVTQASCGRGLCRYFAAATAAERLIFACEGPSLHEHIAASPLRWVPWTESVNDMATTEEACPMRNFIGVKSALPERQINTVLLVVEDDRESPGWDRGSYSLVPRGQKFPDISLAPNHGAAVLLPSGFSFMSFEVKNERVQKQRLLNVCFEMSGFKHILENFFQCIKCKGSLLSTLNRGEAADTFSTAPVKQMLMEEEKIFDVKACSGSSPSPYQLIFQIGNKSAG
ncbi:hypothetical protein Anapl_11224 [Anas platyrhynchos]|uniref:Uncharacterized protein n=1 Tax=Anas platyrhynchos TaxID=8839 RepID=R0L8A6_ANAPL|nr:hypothetical protein Anapl_11224 [Anas platyrhynchos]